MKPQHFLPPCNLQPYVAKILYVETESTHFSFRTLPRNFPGIFFPAPDSGHLRINIGDRSYSLRGGQAYYAGIGFQPSDITFIGKVKTWVIMLQPYAAAAVLNDSPKSLVNDVTCLSDFDTAFTELAEKLWSLSLTKFETVHLIYSYLLRLTLCASIQPFLHGALISIKNAGGNVDIPSLASENCFSQRHFLRHFSDHIGINPKKYCAMIRFSLLLHDLLRHPHRNIEEAALHHGYYDLSHMHREAQNFLGHIPSRENNWRAEANLQMI